MINENSLYMIEGSELKELNAALTEINAMSVQKLDGDKLRDLVQKEQLHADAAIEADDGDAANETEFVT